MHEEANGKGDIEATLWLNFGGLHAWGIWNQSSILEQEVLRRKGIGMVFQPASHLETQQHSHIMPNQTGHYYMSDYMTAF